MNVKHISHVTHGNIDHTAINQSNGVTIHEISIQCVPKGHEL